MTPLQMMELEATHNSNCVNVSQSQITNRYKQRGVINTEYEQVELICVFPLAEDQVLLGENELL